MAGQLLVPLFVAPINNVTAITQAMAFSLGLSAPAEQ